MKNENLRQVGLEEGNSFETMLATRAGDCRSSGRCLLKLHISWRSAQGLNKEDTNLFFPSKR